MELFFNSNSDKNIKEVAFDSFESSHICKSKRKKIGDTINFTDGNGNLYNRPVAAMVGLGKKRHFYVVAEGSKVPASTALEMLDSLKNPPGKKAVTEKTKIRPFGDDDPEK